MKFFTRKFTITSLQPVLDNEYSFTFIRSYLLNRPIITEYKLASRIANTINPQDHDATDDPLVRAQLNKKSKWIDNLIVHYTHEARLESYNYKATLVHRRPHRNNHQ
jgi:hypothetical protein